MQLFLDTQKCEWKSLAPERCKLEASEDSRALDRAYLAAMSRAPVTTYGLGRPARSKPGGKVLPFESPTVDALARHAQRFGPEGVKETASLYGVNMKVKKARPKVPRQRRTTEELRHQVVELRERGLVKTAIADALNISDQRVRTILAAEKAA